MKTGTAPGRMRVAAGWILLLGLSILLSSCLRWFLEEPSFTLRQVTLSPRSFTQMDILLGIEVHNPNRFDLTLASFEYSLQLDQQEIGAGRLEKEIVIPASSTSMIYVPVAATFKNLGASLKTVLFSDNVPYKIEGKAGIRAIFGQVSFPFSKEGRLNAKDS